MPRITFLALLCTLLFALPTLAENTENEAIQVLTNAGVAIEKYESTKTSSVSFWKDQLTRENVEQLRKVSSATRLTIGGAKLTEENIDLLCDHRKLNSLIISNSNIDEKAFAKLKGLPGLLFLKLHPNDRLSGEIFQWIAKSPNLLMIDVDHASISGNSLKPLTTLKHLGGLMLSDCKISTEANTQFSKLLRVSILDLHKSSIGDDFAINIGQMPRLEELDICGTKMTNEGLTALVTTHFAVKSAPALHILASNSEITESYAKELMTDYSDLKIDFRDPMELLRARLFGRGRK